jgi:hypothetical protein
LLPGDYGGKQSCRPAVFSALAPGRDIEQSIDSELADSVDDQAVDVHAEHEREVAVVVGSAAQGVKLLDLMYFIESPSDDEAKNLRRNPASWDCSLIRPVAEAETLPLLILHLRPAITSLRLRPLEVSPLGSED